VASSAIRNLQGLDHDIDSGSLKPSNWRYEKFRITPENFTVQAASEAMIRSVAPPVRGGTNVAGFLVA
jgi:hypothetical protein